MNSGKYGDNNDWMKMLQDPNFKPQDVEEKFYQREDPALLTYLNSFIDGENTPPKGDRGFKSDKTEGGAEGDEKQEAKFEGDYDGQEDAPKEKSVRKNRDKRTGGGDDKQVVSKGSFNASAEIKALKSNKPVTVIR